MLIRRQAARYAICDDPPNHLCQGGMTMSAAAPDKTFRLCAAMLMLVIAGQAAQAGPLRERLAERRLAQAQQQNEALDDSEDTAGMMTALPAGVQVVRDVAYGRDDEQRFDVYLPRKDNLRNAPVIFMVHGGGWYRGDKALRSVVENKVAYWVSRGYILISTNYRLVPKAMPLEQADDVARALAVAQRRAASWGGDPSRFILMGHSAGAHLVALLSAAPEKAQRLGAAPWLGSVLLDSAAVDVVALMEHRHPSLYDRAFGSDPLYWRRASPYQQLTAGATPMLAVCSSPRTHSCEQARDFAAKAATLGARVQVSEQPLSHREINVQLGEAGAYTDAVDAFIRSLADAH
ncbi:MAG TPA: alpha/beta hydrolase [Noviherbaspirillum sp.]|nr:alpha/beta hydrolase [Noviherbaspirillum sp.]